MSNLKPRLTSMYFPRQHFFSSAMSSFYKHEIMNYEVMYEIVINEFIVIRT